MSATADGTAPRYKRSESAAGSKRTEVVLMADIAVHELNRLDEIFAGNRLLATFDSSARELIEPYGELVELETGQIVLNRGDLVLSTLFPVQPTTISFTIELSGGRTVETALIGRRGAVGGIISCGHAPAFTKAIVLVGGPALRVPMSDRTVPLSA